MPVVCLECLDKVLNPRVGDLFVEKIHTNNHQNHMQNKISVLGEFLRIYYNYETDGDSVGFIV